jgi:hypothetical protein
MPTNCALHNIVISRSIDHCKILESCQTATRLKTLQFMIRVSPVTENQKIVHCDIMA